jgi:hypothetical protein
MNACSLVHLELLEVAASSSRRCKILYIISQLGWGGSEGHSHICELNRKRYSVSGARL